MSFWDPDYREEWFRRLTGMPTRRLNWFGRDDFPREFDLRRTEMERMSEEFKDFETKAPKDLVKEYETPEGTKVKEFGPIVYGYSMTVGPDGIPRVQEFGNVHRPKLSRGGSKGWFPEISSEREPLADVSDSAKEVKVTVEMPGIEKKDIKVSASEDQVEVTAGDSTTKKKYRKLVDLPTDVNIETARSTFTNGILEITFDKKASKSKGKQIRVD